MSESTNVISKRVEILSRNLRKILKKKEVFLLKRFMSKINPAELAHAISTLSLEEQVTIFENLDDPKRAAKILTFMDEEAAADIFEEIPDNIIKKILLYLPSDDVISILDEVEDKEIKNLVDELPAEKKIKIANLNKFPEDSAGRLMVPSYFKVVEDETLENILDEIKKLEDVETLPYIYVEDKNSRLTGVVSIKQLISNEKELTVKEIMNSELLFVKPETDQEDVAKIMARYNIIQLPVVNDEMKLLGIITVDDVVDVISEEAEEDMLKMAGAGDNLEEGLEIKKSVFTRVPWLFASWIGGIVEISVLHIYEPTIQQITILASFMPIILGMGGNIGQQSAAIIIAGLASGRINVKGSMRILLKQVAVGTVLGIIYGILVGIVAAFSAGDMAIFPLVIVISMIVEMTVASLIGTALPLFFELINVDPAVATGPFISTTMDIVGILTYFNVSILLLSKYL